MRRSIRFKLIATYVGLAAVSLAVVIGVVFWALHRQYVHTYQYVVSSQARLMSTMLTAYGRHGPIDLSEMESVVQKVRWRPDVFIHVLDRAGRHPSLPAGAAPPEVRRALSGKEGYGIRFDLATRQQRVFAASPVGAPGRIQGVVHVSVPTAWIWRQLQQMLPYFGGAYLLGLAAAWFVGARLARSLTDPVQALTRAADRFREGDLDQHIDIRTGDEIARLGSAFQAMAARLRENIQGLTEERNKVDVILTSMVDALIATDRDGRIALVNRAAEELLELNGAGLGRPAAEVLPPALVAMLGDAAVGGRMAASELPGQGERVVEVHCAPIKGDGALVGAVAVLRDVSELRKSERLRRELTANVSHELRTPLTSIKGFAETLLGGAMSDEATCRRFLGIIDGEANRLMKLVDDLMDLSRLENRGATLDLAPVNVGALVEEMLAQLRPLAGPRALEVRDGDAEVAVMGDRDRLAQVLTNLIDNAIKFTPETGRVEVAWSASNGSVQVTVRDDGAGIPSADLPRIFERFYKADRSRSGQSGSGLGLAITRRIVEAHGGRITVASSEGQGTTVTLTLPAANGEARPAQPGAG